MHQRVGAIPLVQGKEFFPILKSLVVGCEPFVQFDIEFIPTQSPHQLKFDIFLSHPPFHGM